MAPVSKRNSNSVPLTLSLIPGRGSLEKSLERADTAFVVKLFIVAIEMVHMLSTKPKNARGA